MYYLLEWPDFLRDKFHCSSFFLPSNDRSLIAIISTSTIFIYHTKTQLLTAQYERSTESLEHYGINVCALWKPDDRMFALATNLGFVLLIAIEVDNSSVSREYHNTILNVINPKFFHPMSSSGQRPPALTIKLVDALSFESAVTCMDHYFNDFIVATADARICRVEWNGKPVFSEILHLDRVLFYYDLEHTKAGRIEEENVFCTQIQWAPTFNGLFLLLNTGKSALLCLPAGRLDIGQVEGIWATHLKFASCMAVNFRYRSVAFGGRNGEGAIYVRDDASGSLQLMQRLKISARECPDAAQWTGGVRQLSWSPDWSALVMVWDRGGFSIWSPFGSLMFSTLGERVVACRDLFTQQVVWGAVGYSLWCLAQWKADTSSDSNVVSSSVCHEETGNSNGKSNSFIISSREHSGQNSTEPDDDSEWSLQLKMPPHSEVSSTERVTEEPHGVECVASVLVFHLTRSALTTNPTVFNHDHLLALAHTNLFITSRRDIIHGKCFQSVPYPEEYLRCQWPIRFGVVDQHGERVAIAGSRGCAHCRLSTRRWRLFGNETQERDMEVAGGMAWWKDFLLVACLYHPSGRHQLRGYPSEQKLEDSNCTLVGLEKATIMLNAFRDTLLILSVDALVSLYDLKLVTDAQNPTGKLVLKQRQAIDISSCIDYPVCVIAITLTTLRSEIVRKDNQHKQAKGDSESFLINYAGRVLLFQRDRSGNLLQDDGSEAMVHRRSSGTGSSAIQRKKPLPFSPPIVVASGVELMWCTPFSTGGRDSAFLRVSPSMATFWKNNTAPYSEAPASPSTTSTHANLALTSDTLWLNCGAQGMRVWLPLHLLQSSTVTRNHLVQHNSSESRSLLSIPAFMSRRIMLPFPTSCYPLVILVEEALLIGIVNDFTQPLGMKPFSGGPNQRHCSVSSSAVDLLRKIPYARLEKYSEIYLHQVIKQLLRKNLGVNALELSKCCRHLSYFPHVLELLLHEILEEEATSKEPIPDALLPRVVAFIQEFPEFLDTVAHCARKTEVALWPHLFSIAGQPKELFESCLLAGELDTAGSYLIILQNMEKAIMSRQHALLLLSSALEKRKWRLAEELIRFLQAIDPRDMSEYNPELGRPSYHSTSPETSSDILQRSFNLPSPATMESGEGSLKTSRRNRTISSNAAVDLEHGTGGSLTLETHHSTDVTSPLSVITSPQSKRGHIDMRSLNEEVTRVLHSHAKHLLANYRVHELAEYAANTPFHDHQFIAWLKKENNRSAAVQDYVAALQSLHRDFEWPLPILVSAVPPPSSSLDPEEFLKPSIASMLTRRKLWLHQLSQEKLNEHLMETKDIRETSSLSAGVDEEVFLSVDTGTKRGNVPHSVVSGTRSSQSSEHPSPLPGLNNSSSHPLNSSSVSLKDIEQMSLELANRGTEKAQLKLKYLRHMFMEAQCWDWCVLIDVVLRDLLLLTRDLTAMAMLTLPLERPSNLSSSSAPDLESLPSPLSTHYSDSTPVDSPLTTTPSNLILMRHLRIRRGLWQLHDWALNECGAYLRILNPLLALPKESLSGSEVEPGGLFEGGPPHQTHSSPHSLELQIRDSHPQQRRGSLPEAREHSTEVIINAKLLEKQLLTDGGHHLRLEDDIVTGEENGQSQHRLTPTEGGGCTLS